jgi:hypothetical protein
MALTLVLMAQEEIQVLLSKEGNGFDLDPNGTGRNTSTVVKTGERL